MAFRLPPLALLAVGVAVALAPPLSTPLRYLPLLASVVLLGLPHGAVDHLALPRVRGERVDRRWLARVGVLYLVLGSVYAVVWFLAPVVGIVSFVLLTWFHWGQGDLYVFARFEHARTRPQRALELLVRGGLPMLVPLLSHPDRYREVVSEVLGLFEVGTGGVESLFRPDVRLAIGAGFALIAILALALDGVRTDDARGWAIDVAEVGLLWAFFWVVPPVFAIGVYFTAWHAPRHVARLLEIDPQSEPDESPAAALVRFAREAAPLSVLSLVFLLGLALLVPNPPETVPGIVALYLVFIAALTLPHTVVVTDMDRLQGVWR